MKTLFCGPVLDFSGFGHAARSLLQAMAFGGMDLVVRPLVYDIADPGSEYRPESWLDPLLKKPLDGIELVIQSTTPNVEAVPIPGVCNGIYTFVETDRIPMHWVDKLNQFDFIIVSSRYNAITLVRSGVKKPVVCIPVPYDMDRLNVEPNENRIIDNPDNRTIFYNICQLSSKKGIDALLRAYYAAFFDKPDEVLLVLKTYINMGHRGNDREIIKQFIERVKQGCRIPVQKLPPVQIITRIMSDAEVSRLHSECHAYVNASRAEGFCLPAFDALAHGKTLISNSFGGMADFVTQDTALVYGGCMTNCYDMPCGDPLQYTGIARWFEPSTAEMGDLMRAYHVLRVQDLSNELDLGVPDLQPDQEISDLQKWNAIVQRQNNGKLVASKHDYRQISGKVIHQFEAAFASWKATGAVSFDANYENAKTLDIKS